jgi:arginase family enzyme
MDLRVIDLDGGLVVQRALLGARPAVYSFEDWAPNVRQACTFGRFRRFQTALAERLGSGVDDRAFLTFYGSGDFHHVTLALLRRLTAPCNLLVIDNHPDWMRGIPVLHCGTWLRHALRLPQIQRVFHVGGDVDFDNGFQWLAPWSALRSGRVTVLSAVRRYRRGAWTDVPHASLRPAADEPLTEERLAELLDPYRRELAELPLYISLDKDVMRAEDAAVNWDSGHLTLPEVGALLEGFVHACGRNLAGVDIVGDWSPVVVNGLMRRLLHVVEHPKLDLTLFSAARVNDATNHKLLHLFRRLGVLRQQETWRRTAWAA